MREDIKDCAEMHGLFCIALVPDVTDRPHAVLSRIKLRTGIRHGSVYTAGITRACALVFV